MPVIPEDLAMLIAGATSQHALNLDESDAAGNNPCVCGEWPEDWDVHWAEVALEALTQHGYSIAAVRADAERSHRFIVALQKVLREHGITGEG